MPVLKSNSAKASMVTASALALQAMATPALAQEAATAPAAQSADAQAGDIIVTAQKREERLLDVPMPVSVVNADRLSETAQVRLQDFYQTVPGVSLTQLGDTAVPVVAIRGITTGGYGNPTTSTVVDDVPFGSFTFASGGTFAPDIDPSDLARIEILRGPQGTLYGAASLGGLLKYVTVEPSVSRVSGEIQAGLTAVKNGDGVGYNVRGNLNVPLSDTFAVRVSGFDRHEPGYVDNPILGLKGVNSREALGGHIVALWQPSANLTIKASALAQRLTRDGEDAVHLLPGLSGLQQDALIDTGVYVEKLEAYSLTAKLDLGAAELTSISGYSVNSNYTVLDYKTLKASTMTQFGVSGAEAIGDTKTSKFTQELRLQVPIGEHIDWLVGGFFADEDYDQLNKYYAVNPATGAIAGTWWLNSQPSKYKEIAGFTNVTFKITDRFDVQFGGRLADIKVTTGGSQSTGPLNTVVLARPTIDFTTPEYTASDTTFTYQISPRFRISDNVMVYARLATGYRPGGPNTNSAAVDAGAPSAYSADTTTNYEIGVKGNTPDKRLTFDLSAYDIEWNDIQIFVRDPSKFLASYIVNGGKARSKGVEAALDVRPFNGFTLSGWVAYNDAKLVKVPSFLTVNAQAGDRLPYSQKWSGNLSGRFDFDAGPNGRAHIGASAAYIGDRVGRFFPGTAPRERFAGYTQYNLDLGYEWGDWSIAAFVNNVTDKRGILRGGRDASLSQRYAFNYIQPRTGGVTLRRKF